MKTTRKPNARILTILGSGTSTGVPMIGCTCAICSSKNQKNRRLRCSAWLQWDGKSILIDTSTDLREQALRARINHVDAVLFTHAHADHIHGIDELRSFNYLQKDTIPLYGNSWTVLDLQIKFTYIFNPKPVEGGGIPRLTLSVLEHEPNPIEIAGVPVTLLPALHGSKEILGFKFGQVAYLTDCNQIPDSTLSRMKDLDSLVLDCVRHKPHGTHYHLEQALQVIDTLRPRCAYLTHLNHEFDYVESLKTLPKGVELAYDGLKINIK